MTMPTFGSEKRRRIRNLDLCLVSPIFSLSERFLCWHFVRRSLIRTLPHNNNSTPNKTTRSAYKHHHNQHFNSLSLFIHSFDHVFDDSYVSQSAERHRDATSYVYRLDDELSRQGTVKRRQSALFVCRLRIQSSRCDLFISL